MVESLFVSIKFALFVYLAKSVVAKNKSTNEDHIHWLDSKIKILYDLLSLGGKHIGDGIIDYDINNKIAMKYVQWAESLKFDSRMLRR